MNDNQEEEKVLPGDEEEVNTAADTAADDAGEYSENEEESADEE